MVRSASFPVREDRCSGQPRRQAERPFVNAGGIVMIRNRLFLVLAIAFAVLPSAQAADAVVSADTYISNSNSPFPQSTLNFGTEFVLNVGPNSSALIQFDLRAIQSLSLSSANIQKATLTLLSMRLLSQGVWMSG
jgi:hypothetical protein